MAKRGERRPWRMTYTFTNGISGAQSFFTEADAQAAATRQRQIIGPDGSTCTARVSPR